MKIVGKSWLALAIAFWPAVVLTQGLQDAGSKLDSIQNQGVNLASDVSSVSNIVVTMIFSLVGTVFFMLMIYAGIVWIQSAGREAEITRAKNMMITAVIGIIVVMASYAITNFALSKLGG